MRRDPFDRLGPVDFEVRPARADRWSVHVVAGVLALGVILPGLAVPVLGLVLLVAGLLLIGLTEQHVRRQRLQLRGRALVSCVGGAVIVLDHDEVAAVQARDSAPGWAGAMTVGWPRHAVVAILVDGRQVPVWSLPARRSRWPEAVRLAERLQAWCRSPIDGDEADGDLAGRASPSMILHRRLRQVAALHAEGRASADVLREAMFGDLVALCVDGPLVGAEVEVFEALERLEDSVPSNRYDRTCELRAAAGRLAVQPLPPSGDA